MAGTPLFNAESGWWDENKPTDRYAGFRTTAGDESQSFFDKAKAAPDPTAGGWDAFKGGFGLDQYPDINDPNTVSTLGKWQEYQQGGMKNFLDQNARTTANQSAATSRFGPAGGPSAGATGAAGVNSTIAGSFGDMLNRAMEYMKEKSLYDQSSAGDFLNATTERYKTDVGAGQGLLAQVLQALNLGGQEDMNWLSGAGAAKTRDVSGYNEYQRYLDQDAKAREAQGKTDAKQMSLQQLINQAVVGDRRSALTGTASDAINKLMWDPAYVGSIKK